VRFIPTIFAVLALAVSPQAWAGETEAIDKAQTELERIRSLVDIGAMPRIALETAESQLADAKDETILAATLYGKASVQDLTTDQAAEMVAAAQREIDRQQQKIDAMSQRIDAGVIS